MSKCPILSVIIPVYNSKDYLEQCLNSILSQKIDGEIQIICVDDGSNDGSLQKLRTIAIEDNRITIVEQSNLGAGVARNTGLKYATGTFVHFLDSDDWIEENAYSFIINKMIQYNVDVFIFQKYLYDNRTGLSKEVIKAFSSDDYITNIEYNPSFFIHSPVVPWNKIIRRCIIEENNLRYDNTLCANDRTFYYALISRARSVMVSQKPLIYYRVNNSKSLIGTKRSVHYDSHFTAYYSTIEQTVFLDIIEKRMIADAAMIDMMRFYDRAHPVFKFKIYIQLYFFFQTADLFGAEKEKHSWVDRYNYIKHHKYGFPFLFCKEHFAHYRKMIQSETRLRYRDAGVIKKGLIASLTSYPARINTVDITIQSLLNQTVMPEKLILWLAEDQFPRLEDDLPKKLLKMKSKGLTICFCDDLKSHKKYFYTMQEHPDDTIITFDDDLIYDCDVVECLVDSYHRHPHAVSAMRVHRIVIKNGKIMPYSQWGYDDNTFFDEPSMYAMATGVAGVLYPPHSLHVGTFNKKNIVDTCLFGDDLWLKANELLANTPTVLASRKRKLKYVEGTQETSLWIDNKTGKRNDVYFGLIDQLIKHDCGKSMFNLMSSDSLRKKVTFLVNAHNMSFKKLLSFCNSMPTWAEAILFGDIDEGVVKSIREHYGPSIKVRLMHQRNYCIPLHSLAACSNANYIYVVDINNIDSVGIFDSIGGVMNDYDKIIATAHGNIISSDILIQAQIDYFDNLALCVLHRIINDDNGIVQLENIKIDTSLYNSTSLRRMLYHAGYDTTDYTNDESVKKFLSNNNIFLKSEEDQAVFDSMSMFDSSNLSLNSNICPICGVRVRKFLPGGFNLRDGVECPYCGSWERHRSMWMMICKNVDDKNDSVIAMVNCPSKTKKVIKQYGVDVVTIKEIMSRDSIYSIIALCHIIKNNGDIESLKELSSKLFKYGVFLISLPVTLKNGVWIINDLEMTFREFTNYMRSIGFDTKIRWNKESFSLNELELYSIIGIEVIFICSKL